MSPEILKKSEIRVIKMVERQFGPEFHITEKKENQARIPRSIGFSPKIRPMCLKNINNYCPFINNDLTFEKLKSN